VNIHSAVRDNTDPPANLAYEEALFNSLRAAPQPACLFYVNDPCIVLGRGNVAEQWVHLAATQADNVPVLRRFTGGGAVYLDHGVLNFSFIVPKSMLAGPAQPPAIAAGPQRYIDFFRGVVIRALSRGGVGYSATGVSDISLNGRKVSGNAQRVAANLVLHHGTLLLRCPLDEIERYLKVPPNRAGVPHAGFVTGLSEEGRLHTQATLREWLAAEFKAACLEIIADSD
jgi:lipoate-protein ligase A